MTPIGDSPLLTEVPALPWKAYLCTTESIRRLLESTEAKASMDAHNHSRADSNGANLFS